MKKCILVCLVLVLCFCLCACKSSEYKDAMSLYDSGEYQQAKELFSSLEDYKDAAEFVKKCSYQEAIEQYTAGEFEQAKEMFAELAEYEDSAEFIKKCSYQDAIQEYEAGQYQQAKEVFTALGEYEDSVEYIKKCDYAYAVQLLEKDETGNAANILKELGEYDGAPYYLGLCYIKEKRYEEAIASFEKIAAASEYYSDAAKGIEECICEIFYLQAIELCDKNDLNGVREILPKLTKYPKAKSLIKAFKQLDNEGFAGEYKKGGTMLEIVAHISTQSFERSYTVIIKDKKKELTYNPCIVVGNNKILLQDETDLVNRKKLYHNCKETVLIEEEDNDTGSGFWGMVSPAPDWETELLYLEKTDDGITEYEQKSYGAVDNHIAKDEYDLKREQSEPKRVEERKFTPVISE